MTKKRPESTLDRLYPIIPPADRRPLGWVWGGRVAELRAALAVKS